MRILKYCIRNDWNPNISKKIYLNNILIHKKVFLHVAKKKVHVNNGRWKLICWINSSMHIKKVMRLCVMGRHNLPNQWTGLIAQHLKCCCGHSEMSEQGLLSKFFCIIASQNCYMMTVFQNSRHPRKQWLHSLCFICSLWGTFNLLYMKIIIFICSSHFSLWYLVPVYQEVPILFSLTRRMEMVLIRKCFMQHTNFAHRLN